MISVSPERLSYESRALDGSLVDAFQLTKAAATGTVYVNKAPGPGAAKQEH